MNMVVKMPTGKKVTVFFIPLSVLPSKYKSSNWISDDNLEKALNELGFKSANLYSIAAANEADPSFASKYPNGTHWKDENGKWCSAAFNRVDNKKVSVNRYGAGGWNGDWCFAAEKIEEQE